MASLYSLPADTSPVSALDGGGRAPKARTGKVPTESEPALGETQANQKTMSDTERAMKEEVDQVQGGWWVFWTGCPGKSWQPADR